MNNCLKKLSVLIGAFLYASLTPASADVLIAFNEGAPKDRFTFRNAGKCSIKSAQLTLDLSGSNSGLIFDVTDKGAGVEVFQPLQFVSGIGALSSIPSVADGDDKVVLNISELKPDESIAFTIDVDDTMGEREITVSGSEIAGAVVALSVQGVSSTSAFASNARSTLKVSTC